MNVNFRRAVISDMETLIPLMQAYYDFDGFPFDEEKARQAVRNLLENEAFGLAWLIEADGATAGYMVVCFGYSLEFGGRDAFVDELYLLEAYRGHGIGMRAMEKMLDASRQQGANALHLEVMVDNRKAIAFYERMGFVYHSNMLMSCNLTGHFSTSGL